MPDEMSAVAHDTDVEPAQRKAPDQSATGDDRLQALSAELAKWQSRVPKLAAALKQRTAQVSELEAQLAARDDSDAPVEQSGAGVRARDELIAELETKQRELKDRQRQAEAQLHARDAELTEVQQELAAWREKWQALANELDAQATQAQTAQQQLESAQAEIGTLQNALQEHEQVLAAKARDQEESEQQVRSLEARNDKLFETTELANTQIEALGESLVTLKARLSEREAALVELGEAHDVLTRSAAEHQQASEALSQELDSAHSASEQQRTDHADRMSLAQSEIQSLKELVADQVRQMQQLDADNHEHAQEAKATQQALTEELDEAVVARQSLRAEHEQQLGSLEQQLRTAHAHSLLAQEQAHEQTLAANRSEYAQQLEQARGEHAAQLASHTVELAHVELASETQQEHFSAERNELVRQHDATLAALQAEQERQLHSQHSAHAHNLLAQEQAQEQALATAAAELSQRLEDVRQEHAVQTAAQQSSHQAALAHLQLAADTQVDDLSKQLRELTLHHDQALAAERTTGSEQQDALVSELERANAQRTQIQVENEQAQAALAQAQTQLEQIPAMTERLQQLEQEHREAQEALAHAGQVNAEQNSQRDQLTARVRELEAQCSYGDEHEQTAQKLRSQLESVEAEKLQQGVTIAALEAQVANLDDVRAERDSYISAVLGLEDELQALKRARSQDAPDREIDSPAANAAAVLEHAAEVRRLEDLIRERTEEANELRWQLSLKEQAQSEADSAAPLVAAGGDKMLLVLNQQLQMAQQENERLAAKVRQLSAGAVDESATAPPASETEADDLTLIRGIGDKLATQLAELGITTFAQIADLEPSVIEHEQHPLYGHRSRITRDEWISQAAALR